MIIIFTVQITLNASLKNRKKNYLEVCVSEYSYHETLDQYFGQDLDDLDLTFDHPHFPPYDLDPDASKLAEHPMNPWYFVWPQKDMDFALFLENGTVDLMMLLLNLLSSYEVDHQIQKHLLDYSSVSAAENKNHCTITKSRLLHNVNILTTLELICFSLVILFPSLYVSYSRNNYSSVV